jgi:hypothetical protein
MSGRSWIVASAEQCVELRDLAGSDDREEADRARAILLSLDGWTSDRIALAFCVQPDSMRHWRIHIRGFRQHPLEGQPVNTYDPAETTEQMFHRFDRMVERGIRPYPMVFDRLRRDLVAFQRRAVTDLYRAASWSESSP